MKQKLQSGWMAWSKHGLVACFATKKLAKDAIHGFVSGGHRVFRWQEVAVNPKPPRARRKP